METRKPRLMHGDHMYIPRRGTVSLSPPGNCVRKETTVNNTTFVFEFAGTETIKHMVEGVYEGYRMLNLLVNQGKQAMLQHQGKCLRTNLA